MNEVVKERLSRQVDRVRVYFRAVDHDLINNLLEQAYWVGKGDGLDAAQDIFSKKESKPCTE
jgi:hypothetical protein